MADNNDRIDQALEEIGDGLDKLGRELADKAKKTADKAGTAAQQVKTDASGALKQGDTELNEMAEAIEQAGHEGVEKLKDVLGRKDNDS